MYKGMPLSLSTTNARGENALTDRRQDSKEIKRKSIHMSERLFSHVV